MAAILIAVQLRSHAAPIHTSPCLVLLSALTTAQNSSDDTFLRSFPFDLYLSTCGIVDINRLETDRTLLNSHGRDGDSFINHLFLQYLKLYPSSPETLANVAELLQIADRALAYRSATTPTSTVYRTNAYMLLDALDDQVELSITTHRLRSNSRQTLYLLSSLAQRGYKLSIPESRFSKFTRYTKEHKWAYISKRLGQELLEYRVLVLVTLALSFLPLLFLHMFLSFRSRRGAHRGKQITIHKLSGVIWLVLALYSPKASAQSLQETEDRQYYQGEMTIRHLYYGPVEIGSTIWIRRATNTLRAKYFASGQVFQKYASFNGQTVLVCSGAFTERQPSGELAPQGLTVDNGVIVNRDRNPKMDGLVIVYPNGGIAVSDIAKDMLTVSDSNGTQKLDILKSADKTAFLDWAVRNQATVFQTQLLASTRGLRLEITKAHKEFRERRFLAVVVDKNTNEVWHVIINVPRSFYLGELTQLVYDYLQQATRVVGLLNLDTGDYNILRVNSPNGETLAQPAGTKPLNTATNLLVYYHAK